MKSKTTILILLVCTFFGLAALSRTSSGAEERASASVQEDAAWLADKERLQAALDSKSITDEERCQITWDILWPWAKKGNLEARGALLFDMYANFREMPGSHDAISRLRDASIMAVHTTGLADTKDSRQFLHSFYQGLDQVGIASERDKFFSCVADNPSQECARIAVEGDLVPSFDHYAAEVDAAIARGMKTKCVYGAN